MPYYMHDVENEMEGLKSILDLMIDKKNRLAKALVIAYDEEKKFALSEQIKDLETEIQTQRIKLQALQNQKKDQTPIPSMNEAQISSVIQKVRDLIAKAKLKEALELLQTLASGDDSSTIILLSARLSSLEGKERMGIIDNGDARIERNSIVFSTLSLANEILANTKSSEAPTSLVPPSIGTDPDDSSNGAGPKKIFFSYSQHDRPYLDQLLRHMAGLRRQGKIVPWNDHDILPGEEWNDAIINELATADIILLLISSDFLATDYIWDVEIDKAMERHERKTARVIPVFIRPCDWSGLPFGKLNGLPSKAKPVSSYADKDEAWVEVVKGIERVL